MPLLVGTQRGVTRNISSSGVYFLTAGQFDPGQVVQLSLPASASKNEGSSLTCEGRIARLKLEDGQLGIAVKFDPFIVIRPSNFDLRRSGMISPSQTDSSG